MLRRKTIATALGLSLSFAALPALAQSREDTVIAAFSAETTTLDPARSTGTVDRMYYFHLFEMLVIPDDGCKMSPWLATRWEVGDNQGKPFIEVWLRDDVKFHNGDPMTAADVEFSWQRQRDPKVSFTASRHRNVDRFEIIDDHHFKIHFNEPDGNYLAEYLQIVVMPKNYFEQVGGIDQFAAKPVGTGPWEFVSRSIKQEIRFTRNEGYWNSARGPKAKNLIIKIIPEDLTRVSALRAGEVDWIDNVPLPLIEEFKQDERFETFSVQNGNMVFLDMPSYKKDTPFAKLEVRQAIAHGFDMDAILETVLYGQGNRFAGVGTDSTAYDPNLQPYAYDPAKSQELLAKAGYPDGLDIPCYSLTTPREPNIKEVGEAIYAYLQQVGIRCDMRAVEYGAWLDLLRRTPAINPGPLDGLSIHMSAQGIPSDPGNSWSSSTLHSYASDIGFGTFSQTADEKADAYVRQVQQTMDMDKRRLVIMEANAYRQERVLGGISLYQPMTTYAWSKRIDFTPWAYPGYWHLFQLVDIPGKS